MSEEGCGRATPPGLGPCTRERQHAGPCAHPQVGLTLEVIELRNEARFAQLGERFARLADALKDLGASQIEAQRLAGAQNEAAEARAQAAPLAQLRERLVAGCYQIRLRAACEDLTQTAVRGSAGVSPTALAVDHTALAVLANADAEAVLRVLRGPA